MKSELSAKAFIPEGGTLQQLHRAAQRCQGCELYRAATQAVLGEGPVSAQVMLVGEQPGDREDLAGRPFVGPAGALLDRALADAGIDRSEVYVTNAVKHFKFEKRGKRRIHKKRALQTPGPVLIEAVIDPNEPPMPPKVTARQAAHFMESLAKGTPDRRKIIETIVADKVREMV